MSRDFRKNGRGYGLRLAPLVLLVAGTALAASPEGTVITPAPAKPAAPQPNAPAPTPGTLDSDGTYTIKSGDTLWDLSQQFLNNPWYWPKIWADNPGVENPHWIYPGNRLKISKKGAGVPGEVGPVKEGVGNEEEAATENESAGEQAAIGGTPAKPGEELPDFSSASLKKTTKIASDEVTMGGSYRPDLAVLPTNVTKVHVASVITDGELAETGTISTSFEERGYLQPFDRVYLKMPNPENVKMGDVLTIFRTGAKIMHPVTRLQYGLQTQLVGTVKIIGKNGEEIVGEIGNNITDAIARGDRVAPNASLDKAVKVAPNTVDLRGVVLVSQEEGQTIAADNHVIFIDKGSADGVQDGNTFTVMESGDGLDMVRLPGEKIIDKPGPHEAIATLLVYNVSEHTSATMIIKSTREVTVGDNVVMIKASEAGAGSGGN